MTITRIQLRRGTAAEWAAANPVLAAGEVGVELGTPADGVADKTKIGDGTTHWNSLLYDGAGAFDPAGAAAAAVSGLNGTYVAVPSDANRNTKGAGTGVLGALTTGVDNTGEGSGALGAVTSGRAHTAFGAGALAAVTTAVGTGGLGDDEASNSAFGTHALRTLTTGSTNSAFGGSTLYNATTAVANCAFGSMALEVCIDGTWNVAVGAAALNYFQHPTGHTAVGFQALCGDITQAPNTGNYNAAFGFKALTATAAGSVNTGVGPNAGLENVGGNNNTFIGSHAGLGANVAGHSTRSGSQNTWLGTQSGPGDTSDPSACTAVGYNTTCIGNGSVAIGTDHTNAGAAATAQDQMMLGTALHTVTIPGAISLSQGAAAPLKQAGQYADMLGWTFDPVLATRSLGAQGATNMFLFRVPISGPTVVTNVHFYLAALGNTLTNAYAVAYRSDGTKIGQSADQSTAWGAAGATGLKTIALAGGPFTVTPLGSNDFIWVGFYVGTAVGTPAFQGVTAGGIWNVGTAGARTRAGYTGIANTATLPTITPAGLAQWSDLGWAAIS